MSKYSQIHVSILLIVLVGVLSCSKDIANRTADAPALEPVRNDANAGGWAPILLKTPTDILVDAPISVGTPDYVIQINEVKSWQARMDEEDKKNVKYWSAGAILRWNEIMRQLVAKCNLPPFQNPDGTYPVPSASNPLAYPTFPFANPPYAARAYAYVAAAQYDALVAAYHYKSLYKRPAPYAVDQSLKVLIPRSDLPSYPSEDAVVAGAATEMLRFLFPGDQDLIMQKAEDHKRARIMSGANVRSDLEAGEALGRAVAQRFIARARTDGASVAVGTPTFWAKLEQDAISRGEIPWISQETPRRPPMLPLFGKVRTFLFDSTTLKSLRPGPPPSSNGELKKQAEEVYQIVKNLTRDQMGIAQKWNDGVGTHTPPGHWNAIAVDDFISQRYSEVRWARNMALLNMALMDAAVVCWDIKYMYFNPRPSQLDPRIKTCTGLPNFPAYISGHSTFSGAASAILGFLLPQKSSEYAAMAKEASLSRIYGGIHYRSDCEVGLQVGIKVGDFAVQRARIDGAN